MRLTPVYKYICLNCSHEWNTLNNRGVLRCSNCHRNQGVNYEKFRKAVEAAKTALRKVAASPPPYPPPLEIIGLIPEALEPVLEVARKEFPSPLVPFNCFKEILQQAITELKRESSLAQTRR